jgi:hypothetical protein
MARTGRRCGYRKSAQDCCRISGRAGQFAGLLEAGKFRWRHQVVLEILELAGALHPDVAGAQCVLHLRQRAQFVVTPVDSGVGHHQLLPARLDEIGRRVRRHLAGIVAVHDFVVGDGGHTLDGKRDQGRVAARRLELGQVGGRHLAALAGNLEQPVLVNRPLDAGRQVERLPRLEAFDVFQHVPRVRFDGRLAQPGQPGRFAVVPALEQIASRRRRCASDSGSARAS